MFNGLLVYTKSMSKYWFRKRQGLMSKDMGYGWIPITIEGWLVIVALLTVIVLAAIIFALSSPLSVSSGLLLGVIVLATVGLGAHISRRKTRP